MPCNAALRRSARGRRDCVALWVLLPMLDVYIALLLKEHPSRHRFGETRLLLPVRV